MTNIRLLRELLNQSGFETYGEASPIVCVKMGSEGVARLVSRRLHKQGLVSNLVEFPAVPKGQARFRMQVMANHTARDVMDAVHRMGAGFQHSVAEFDAISSGDASAYTAFANAAGEGRGAEGELLDMPTEQAEQASAEAPVTETNTKVA